MAKPSKTTDQAGVQITRGEHSWATKLDTAVSLTWAFRSSIPANYVNSDEVKEGTTFQRMNAAERDAVRDALDLFSDVAKIKFTQLSASGKTDDFTNSATMLFGTYSADDGAAAFANLPSKLHGDKSVTSNEGDVWYNRRNSSAAPTQGMYDFEALAHEIGHSLGLEHPGNYNAAKNVTITYNKYALYAEDTRQYSIMSYFEASASGNGANHSYVNSSGQTVTVYASTLLLDDIAAIQRLYGATSARTGDTVYGFHSNADIPGYKITGSAQAVFCMYDTGGDDTLDVSGYKTDQKIDLHAEAFSDVGALKKNVSIAEGVTIENAIGGSGDDTITGNAADNTLKGGAGDDALKGMEGDDVLFVGLGKNQTVDGGTGTDTASFADLDKEVNVALSYLSTVVAVVKGEGSNTLRSIENLIGSSADDTLYGDIKTNTITGGDGDDTIRGGDGVDRLDGGLGSDTISFSDKTVDVFAQLLGATLSTALVGTALKSEDSFKNFENILGGGGNDTLIGDAAVNTLNGGEGNDVLRGGGGKDLLVGGIGEDTASFAGLKGDIVATIDSSSAGTAKIDGVTAASYKSMENLTGGSGSDTLTGNDGANVLDGGSGNDTLRGSGGNDTLVGGSGTDTVDYIYLTDSRLSLYLSLDANGDGTARVFKTGSSTPVETDIVKGIESILAGAGNDVLYGNSAANVIRGNGGDDHIMGGAGKDIIDGGAGVNTAMYYDRNTPISVTMNDTGNTTVYVGGIAEDTLTNIQNIYGSGGNDYIVGNTFVNFLSGGFGDDTLVGGAGFDTLDGGVDSDTVDYHLETRALAIDLSVTNVGYVTAKTSTGLALDQLYSIENLIGGSGADKLTGDYNNNRLVGGAGFDILSGGYGNDVLQPGAGGGTVDGGDGIADVIDFSDQTKAVVLALISGGNNATFKIGGDALGTVRNVEDVVGGSGNDKLTGDDDYNGNKLTGGAGDDALYGKGGDDHLVGGAGKDFLDGGDGSDTADYSDHTANLTVTLTGAESNTALYSTVKVNGVVEDTLVRIERIIGGSGNDTMTATDSSDNYFRGGGGKDVLDGGANGYYGDTVDYSDKDKSVVVTLNGASNATVYVNGVAEDTIRNIENVNGGSGNDTLIGDNNQNFLNGGDGDDTFKLSGGFDYFDGGYGKDTLDLSAATGAISLKLQTFYATLTIGSTPMAYVSNMDKVIGGSFADTLNGGMGLTTMTGAGGRDTFVFDSAVNGFNITTLTDFHSGFDRIEIDHNVFSAWSAATPGTSILPANYTEGTTSVTNKTGAQIIYNTTNGGLYYDGDGKGGAASIEFAVLTGTSSHHLLASDFFII